MNRTLAAFTFVPALALVLLGGASIASADGGHGYGGMGKGMGFNRGGGAQGLISTELREEFRENCATLTPEEREERRETMHALRDAHRAELEEFTGLSREEMRDLQRSGESIGDALAARGISQEEAEEFLTDQANDRVDTLVELRDLSAEDEQSMRDRIADFVARMIDRWFATN